MERLIRTIRNAIRKRNKKFSNNKEIEDIINNYNRTLNSAIKATPEEAWNNEIENLKQQNKADSRYAKRFKTEKREKFVKSQIVAVRQFPKKKENTIRGDTGEIVEERGNDSYIVKVGNKKKKVSHRDLTKLPTDGNFRNKPGDVEPLPLRASAS